MSNENLSVELVKQAVSIIVVYNKENAFDKDYYKRMITNTLFNRANEQVVYFGLSQYKNNFFKDTKTISKEEVNRLIDKSQVIYV